MNRSRSYWRVSFRAFAVLSLSGLLITLSTLLSGSPVTFAQSAAIREEKVNGFLPTPFSKHYLALEPSERDATVVLTMTFDPRNIDQSQGGVNFLVLNEDGMRRFLAGAELQGLDIASGSPLQFSGAGNVLQAAFTASGSGNYTVIVYNNAPLDVTYSLAVQGGVLIDESGRRVSPPPLPIGRSERATTGVGHTKRWRRPSRRHPRDISDHSIASTTPTTAAVSPVAAVNVAPQNVRARRVSGELTGPTQKHYLSLEPGARDAEISLVMNYDPQDKEELVGKINFWVLDEDGVRRMVRGDNPRDLNLATGFPSPYSPNRNELSAAFKAAGEGPYTVVMYNISDLLAMYALRVESALLVDQYGQTNESKAASAEVAAIQAAESAADSAAAAAPLCHPRLDPRQRLVQPPPIQLPPVQLPQLQPAWSAHRWRQRIQPPVLGQSAPPRWASINWPAH
ncbi:MAG: hypothetical protein HC802_06465 [Caldilineaceae bacterium]|nr:hypothetical protein [Caldilineaceae bacterium]